MREGLDRLTPLTVPPLPMYVFVLRNLRSFARAAAESGQVGAPILVPHR